MEQQNMELTKDQIIQELIALLNQNQQREAANNVFEMAALIDGMGKKLESVTEELNSVRMQLEKLEQEKANRTLKATVRKAVDSLEQQSKKMKEQLFEIKAEVKAKSFEIVSETKAKGKAALNKVSEFIGIREKLEHMRDSIHKSIGQTEQTIAKLDSFGAGMREAGQKIANTFRTFADKETVDYAQKDRGFSKTELIKKPFAVKKRLFESMEQQLDAAIDKVKSLSADVEVYKRGKTFDDMLTGNAHEEHVGLFSAMVTEEVVPYGSELFEQHQQVEGSRKATATSEEIMEKIKQEKSR